ncbi:MAG: hypothetical protein CMG58_00310 [Candidatus Marinimicrobia bacterium]|nr:hypothetical protein [Candidatus Neomarinimicrobiota bacterium]
MKKISIVTSTKYLKSKQYGALIKILQSNNIEYEIVNIDKNTNIKLTNSNLIISVGGDGTALRAMKIAWLSNLPVLNIGSGRIGYLVNSLNDIDFNNTLKDKNFDNNKKRTPIIQNQDENLPAFNEIVIIKNSPTRILDIELEVYDQKVKLRADGVIISTSLGSTAYNYSAGGPIVQTSIESIILTPISPFTKFPRSIVVDSESKLNITIPKKQHYSIQFDGVEEYLSDTKTDEKYLYTLSSRNLEVLGELDIPKLDLFLNQILR